MIERELKMPLGLLLEGNMETAPRVFSTTVPQPAKSAPQRKVLVGRYAVLEPLQPLVHGPQLWSALEGHHEVWTCLPYGPWHDQRSFLSWLEQIADWDHQIYFAVVDRLSNQALGCLSYLNVEVLHGIVEVGGIFYSPQLQRTRVGTEAIYLAASHIFDELGYRRLEWKCNEENRQSVQAALRYGFVPEGIFYQHWIVKGQNRNTAWFSMLDGEWPTRKQAFEQWLNPVNFDSAGVQKQPLCLRTQTFFFPSQLCFKKILVE